jgi:hypothetical protein
MNKIKVTEFSDGGHGWLSVPRKLLKELQIEDKITSFSYEKGNRVYLEEDYDLSNFYTAFFNKQGHVLTSDNFQALKGQYFEVKRSYSDRSPIRSYYRYTFKSEV